MPEGSRIATAARPGARLGDGGTTISRAVGVIEVIAASAPATNARVPARKPEPATVATVGSSYSPSAGEMEANAGCTPSALATVNDEWNGAACGVLSKARSPEMETATCVPGIQGAAGWKRSVAPEMVNCTSRVPSTGSGPVPSSAVIEKVCAVTEAGLTGSEVSAATCAPVGAR